MENIQKVAIKLGSHQMRFDIPTKWSVNKLKCLLTSQIPKVQFNKFELKFGDQLLQGIHLIQEIVQEKIKVLELQIVLIQSRQKFQDYYSATMKIFIQKIQHQQLPITNSFYQQTINKVQKIQVNQNIDDNNFQNDQFNDQPFILRIFRVFGFYFLIGIVITFAQLYQVGFILIIIGAYAVIQFYKNRNRRQQNINRRRQQRQQQPQNQQQLPNIQHVNSPVQKQQSAQKLQKMEQIKQQKQQQKQNDMKIEQVSFLNKAIAQILLKCFKVCQIIFCFFLTFFPNWTIQMHLRINASIIQRCKSIVQSYNPKIMQNNQNKED